MAKIISPLTGTLQSIKKQFISKEKLLKSTLNVQKKRITLNRSNAERERFIDYEKVLERPLRSLGKGVKNVVGKRLGFLDSLKTFIVNVLLGFVALRLLKYLPQLIQFATTALKVGNFIIDIGGKILNSLITFVDYGYKAYDHARTIVGKIGGEKAISALDNATSESTKLINQLLIAGMLFSDFSPFAGLSGVPKAMEASVDAIKGNISSEVASATSNAATNAAGKAALGPLATAGVVAGAGLLFSAAGEGVFQLTKWTKGLIGFGPISKFFQVPLGILEGVGTIFDILGAPFRYGIELIRAGFMKMFNMKDGLEKQAKNLGKFDARVRENTRRFAGLFAPVFTFFGQNETAKKLATPGSFGSLYGEKAVKDMGYSGGGKVISVRKYAAGGTVNIPRTEVEEVDIPRGEDIKKKSIKLGASIGGEKSFAKVFPGSGGDASKMNRYDYMIGSYRTISRIPDLGSVFALTAKTLLGDLVTKDDYDRASSSLSSFMLLGLYETNPEAYQKFSSLINIKQFNRAISEFLMKSMRMPLGGIINLLKIQVGLIPKPGEDVDTTKTNDISSDSDMVEGSVPGGQLTMEQLVGLAKGAGFSDGDAVIMAAIAKGESGGNSNAKNFKPPDKSYGLWQINMIGNLGPARMQEFGLQREDQLFDPVTNAKAAYAIRKSQGLSAWTIYKNGAYKNHLSAAEAAKNAPSLRISPTITNMQLGAGYGGAGGKIAGELGRFIDSKGLGNMGSGVHRHPEHPPFSLTSGHSRGSLHYQGRAVDIGGYTREQGPILAAVAEFNKLKGVKPVQVYHGGNDPDHADHVHVAYAKGGRIHKPIIAMIGEKGPEFVFDANTTAGLDKLAPQLLEKLNFASTKPQLASILQSYASYDTMSPQTIIVQSPSAPSGGRNNNSSGGGVAVIPIPVDNFTEILAMIG